MIKSLQTKPITPSSNIEEIVQNMEMDFEQEIKLFQETPLAAPKDVVEYALKMIQTSTKEGSSLSECQ